VISTVHVCICVCVDMHMCDIPAARLVETHTAEVSGAAEACGVAGDPPVCDTE